MDAVRQMILWKKRAAAVVASTPLLDTYTGAAAAYSMRLLRTTYAGQCLRLRRSTDNVESDFGFLSGWLDTAAILTWLSGATGYVTTWYDQSGNSKNVTQATSGNQHALSLSEADIGGKPALIGTASTWIKRASNDVWTGTDATVAAVGKSTGFIGGVVSGTICQFGSIRLMRHDTDAVYISTATSVQAYTTAGTFPVNTGKAFATRRTATGAYVYTSTDTGFTAGTCPSTTLTVFTIGDANAGGVSLNWLGPIAEVVLWANLTTDQAGVMADQNAAFSLT